MEPDWYLPAVQPDLATHWPDLVEPAGELAPVGHAEQAFLRPLSDVYRPAGHRSQDPLPADVAKRPGVHAAQPCEEYVALL